MSKDAPRVASAGTRLAIIAACLGVALCVGTAFLLWHLRGDAVDSQSRELGLVSLALTDEIDRGLQGIEAGLRAIRGEIAEGRLHADDPQAGRALQTRAQLMAMIGNIWLVDPQGRVLAASGPAQAPALSQFSAALEHLPDLAVAVSRPFSPADSGPPLVALAMRLAARKGTPQGWMLASMPAQALLGAFSIASPAEDARMAVFRDDGVRLAGSIVESPRLDEATLARRLALLKGTELRRFRDGSERLIATHRLPRFGIEVVLTRELSIALVSWRQAARLTAAALAFLLAVLAGSVVLVLRADRRRAAAQQALLAQSARAGKLESLGTMAGGVAHDFNNILAAIIGFGEMAQDAAPAGSAQARHLDKSMQAALRGKALVERILTFSSGGGRDSLVFALQPVVEEVLDLLAASMRPGIVVERALHAPGARQRGDPTRAFEAVMNLCTNAMQAMPQGGTLRVALDRVQVEAPRVLSHTRLLPGNFVALTVTDQGTGISPDVMEHLFEPFFTTRKPQDGTGLGLAVVHGVIGECGGAIDVRSEPGRGACFTLYFPETPESAGAPAAAPRPPPKGAGQTVLVVDDEAALIALAEEMLAGLGYRAVGFTDPRAALEAVRAAPGKFAAAITDELMPGMSGTDLAKALKALAPHMPVLVQSGYGGAMLASRALAAGAARVLNKPMRRAELAFVLDELLS
jgi:signal transduction histidine kinase